MTTLGPPRILVFAQTYSQAQHWARQHDLSPLRWTYVTGAPHVRGHYAAPYVVLVADGEGALSPAQRDALDHVRLVADGVPWTPEQAR